jgi:bifunctional non-homologous end joining protein LigD
MIRDQPEKLTAHLSKARRGTRIFIDTLRNRRGATWIAPYSPRARSGAPVSVPIRWEEVTPRMRPETFNVPRLLEQRSRTPLVDAWEGIGSVRQTITASVIRAARRGSG